MAAYGKGLSGLLKKSWNEIPGVTASSCVGLVGLVLAFYGINKSLNSPTVPKYKRDYIVVRSDDPRANQPERTYPLGDYFKK